MTDRKAKGLANATVNREIELLRRAMRLGVESKCIIRMPVFPKRLPEKNARQGFLETGDFLKLLPHLPEPIDDMARFAFETGWRSGMLRGMRWSHVDRAGRLVALPDSKNDDPQSVPLQGDLLEVIERRWKAREYRTREGAIGVSAYVFHRDGKPIPQSTLNHQFSKARKKVGLVGRLFHDLRRTAARNMVRGGVPEAIVMKVMGHRTRSMLDRYNIASLEDKADALRRGAEYAQTRVAVGQNVAVFPDRTVNATDTRTEKSEFFLTKMERATGFEPATSSLGS